MKVSCYLGNTDKMINGTFLRKTMSFGNQLCDNYIKWDDGVSTQCDDRILRLLRGLYIKHNSKLGKILYK